MTKVSNAQSTSATRPIRTHIEWIDAKQLRQHPMAQRRIVDSSLRKLKKNFDLSKVGTLHGVIYDRDGSRDVMIVDGQHRHKAMLDLGLGNVGVPVEIHEHVTNDAEACELFLGLNNRAAVDPFSKYENALHAGHPAAVGIVAIAHLNGLRICEGQVEGGIACVSTLMKVWAVDAGKTLSDTLGILIGAWGRAQGVMDGKLVEGLAEVMRLYGPSIDKASLVKRLGKYPGGFSALIGDARGLRQFKKASFARCMAEKIIIIYNSKRSVHRIGDQAVQSLAGSLSSTAGYASFAAEIATDGIPI